mmetsp:Transcript_24412/g.33516  ORF Transcript_24412/g.33516 Transcript_24412/m.33516 type:complete len:393 (+) Transcript_24412:26-1204(+)
MALKTFVLFFAFVLAALADECEDYSYAPSAAASIADEGSQLEKGSNFQNAYDILSRILGSYQTNSRDQIYYGLSSENYYAVFDCASPAYSLSEFCSNGRTFVFVVRDFDFFQDGFLHYYRVRQNGFLENRPFADSTVVFTTTAQVWYQQGDGWTDYYEIAEGTRGKSYANSFSDGVAGADRLPSEPCGPCLTGSYPVPIALSWGNGNAPDGSEAISVGDIEAVAKYLIGIITGMTEEIILEAYVGYSNQYFYSVGDCRSKSIKDCTDNWILYARNDFVFGTDSLNTVLLDSDGDFDSQPSASSEEFPTTERPWYIQQNGWADPFTAVTTGNSVRSFSVYFNGGVAASEITLGPDDTCVYGRNGIYETSFYCSAEKLLLSVSLVLLSLVFALF